LTSAQTSPSPHIDPQGLAGKTPAEIGQAARDAGLILRGPDPDSGQGSYVDPVTGEQRILMGKQSDARLDAALDPFRVEKRVRDTRI
jgi:hypothetical protein